MTAPSSAPGAGSRDLIRSSTLADEAAALGRLLAFVDLDDGARRSIVERTVGLIERVRGAADRGLMEVFLAEYGLSTREGIALMCLAEALLRVPDAETIDALIDDKIAPSDWGEHLGRSSSSLVNASTWALLLTGKVLKEDEGGLVGALHGALRRLGEPLIRTAVAQAMKELGRQFVLGRTIEEAVERAARKEEQGYTYSYDMLGEAARTESDARRYHLAYSDAITALAPRCRSADIRLNPGISVKLSALHPRYERSQQSRVASELVARARSLALLAKSAGMGFNIDAEEADRLDLSLDVIEAVLSDPALAGWEGFGVVVQAYGPRGFHVIDWLYQLAGRLQRRIMVRLVKGAYWDTEIKRAQVLGLAGFPVFTRKASTDVSYLACAKKLLGMRDRIYPQFATHNAHTVASVLQMAGDDHQGYEFQRLHGMGEVLHEVVRSDAGSRCRIYAPVGAHRDLLAYLVRRLLENGANSSFVNQVVDDSVPASRVAADPVATVAGWGRAVANPAIRPPARLYPGERRNSRGWDVTDPVDLEEIGAAREPFRSATWSATPLPATDAADREAIIIRNPANGSDIVGSVVCATADDVETAVARAGDSVADWSATPPEERAAILLRAADLYEAHFGELFALACREAGKTLPDCVAELREAVDFLRYYAAEAVRLGDPGRAAGVVACISPWNFPLAIFTGQLAAALAAGNAVLAKPAEQTPLIAWRAVRLLHQAGVPGEILQLLPGDGPTVGAALSAHPGIGALCFTGSTATARRIDQAMASSAPSARLIAETGGLNAMIVDSTALPEQAVRDIIVSSFQSAGQRCSALRMLYIQEDVYDRFMEMLFGAVDELVVGDPWDLATDVGPVIDDEARRVIEAHVEAHAAGGRLMKRLAAPGGGTYCAPAIIRVSGIGDLKEEIFGPVLHVATFRADRIDRVIDDINASGYGLTFGLHTRIDDRVQQVVERIRAGNIYVNRNQIGAIVGSQPFGGEGLSGTGPKAGGPNYVRRFRSVDREVGTLVPGAPVPRERLREALAQVARESARPLSTTDMPGPTGESNRLSLYPRGTVLCLGPGAAWALAQARGAVAAGCQAVAVAPGLDPSSSSDGMILLDGTVDSDWLTDLKPLDAVAAWLADDDLAAVRVALAAREGCRIPVLLDAADSGLHLERHVCVDTTAAGGNASLLGAAEG